ncbi:MAG: HTH domain-containing protein [Haloarcula sp.]
MQFEAESDPGKIRLELFVQSLAPDTAREQQEAIINRLLELSAEQDWIESEVHLAGDCVCSSTVAAETETGKFLLERHDMFEAWAAEHDLSLVGFRQRCVQSTITGTELTGVSFPRCCLAEFIDDDLRFVSPVSDAERQTTTVDDHLNRL